MSEKTYWKDVKKAFSESKGRTVSIASLMALGSFALVGLKVTTPNMQETGQHFFAEHKTADLAVISNYGLDSSDQDLLASLQDKATVEYGYFKDVVIKDSPTAFRLFSKPKELSTYDIAEGRLPEKSDEIAISAAYQGRYKIGDTINFTEKENANGQTVLKRNQFTITGFVNSSEILSRVNMGRSTAGSGELQGYAVVTEDTFDSYVYMIARIAYKNLRDLNPYSQTYTDKLYAAKEDVKKLIVNEPEKRLAEIKRTAQDKIDDGNKQLQDAVQVLTDGQNQLQEAQKKITEGQQQLQDGQEQLADGQAQLDRAQSQLTDGQAKLEDSQSQLSIAQGQLQDGQAQILEKEAQLQETAKQLQTAKDQLEQGQTQFQQAGAEIASKETELQASKTQLDTVASELDSTKDKLDSTATTLETQASELATLRALLSTIQDEEQRKSQEKELSQKETVLSQAQSQYQEKLHQYTVGKTSYQQKLEEYNQASQQLEVAKATLAQKQAELREKSVQYQAGLSQYENGTAALDTAKKTLAEKEELYQNGTANYQEGLAIYQEKLADFQAGQVRLTDARTTLAQKETELAEAQKIFAQKEKEYQEAKEKAEPEIESKRKELKDAQERVDLLSAPTYQVFTRREVPGSEGYISYENNASVIQNVSNIFPVVLYFIAALVTFVTMGRFVEEERIKAGTFKALGYQDKDIIRKFVIYGLVTSMVGTLIGIIAGHTLLPNIIYNTYKSKIVLTPMELYFYPVKSFLAILLGLLSAVLPAYLVAKKELGEKPAQLLLPKPPTAGSKIFLERIRPLWKRMSFTQKVTARNIFRYKQRMLMTIFGVCGSIALLFAGLGIRSSIADLNNRQFTDIIRYDMIVAHNTNTTPKESEELDKLLKDSNVRESLQVHYETLHKTAGRNKDNQEITALVIQNKDQANFGDYIQLKDRKTGQELSLDQDGIILSEKIANLTGVKVGDTLTVQDKDGKDIQLTVSGIAEMYMSHFIFMNEEIYEKAFGKVATDNAHLITLTDHSNQAVADMATEFMDLESVQGVVQNTTLKSQVETIVNSLNRVMGILIAVSVLLAIVVLFNLTNINVAERIRELSTIKVLGFYNKEVTLYIYRETIYLSIVGILVGFGLGFAFHHYMASIIPPDTVMFNPAVSWSIYAVPAAIVVAILTTLGFIVNRWLKKVNMLEALKSVE
ncbi:FtsX-like permease family protein [Streptococcus cristatus]|uniref:ABC transporter permease protein n=1 Tax=Streptococcus cristatus TaxID=45634 RepID=A0A139N5G9_STRCR|nr:FtsX-like permease family protein [Streptococcus cristatus]KXT70991.1 ABC transporter permease protein [Streptococcus cristatus]